MAIVPPSSGFGGAEPQPIAAPEAAKSAGGQPPLNRLERVESRLYSPAAGSEVRRRRILRPGRAPAVGDWAKGESSLSADAYVDSIREKPTSPFAKLLIVTAVFFVAAMAYGGWKLYGGGALAVQQGAEDVRITVAGANQAQGGDAFYFDVVVQNASPVALTLPDLVVKFPPGTKDAETKTHDLASVRVSLGDVAPGATVRKTVGATLYGNEGDVEAIDVRVQYRAAGSDAIFEKSRPYDVALAASPLRVTVGALDRVTSGQAMPLEIHVSSNAASTVTNVGLEVSLPYGYTATKYSVAPTSGTFWLLGDIKPGEEKVIRVDGTLEGSDGDQRTFKFKVGQAATSSGAVAIAYSGKAVTVGVEKPFLGLVLALGGDNAALVARPQAQQIDGLLTLVNNTNAPIRDIQVTLKLAGAALDRTSVQVPNGSFLSADNAVRWDKTTAPELASLAPGSSKTLGLSFRSGPLVVAGQSRYANPEISLDLEAVGQRVSEDGVAEEIKSVASRLVRITSDVNVDAGLAYVEGAQPPQADLPTTYRVNWTLRNSSSNLSGVTLSAPLPPQVSFKGKVSGDGDMTFDAPSRTVIWNIGSVAAGAGYSLPAIAASLDLELVPSVVQVGSHPAVIEAATLSAFDTFADSRVTEAVEQLETDHTKAGQVVE